MASRSPATLTMKLNGNDKEILPGKLIANQGASPQGESYGFTNYYMTRNGRPSIPLVGEFHYSRFSCLYWEEELRKMKAGGINIVASYVFWNHHEEEEGIFDWSGDRNLRHFVDLCAKVGLHVIIRIGPFCHGEVRNGGIPDWVFSKPIEIRSNDEGYLSLAKRLYNQIAKQVNGTFFQEGGPIIAVQLENEFMHCGAPNDEWGYARKFITAGTGGNEHLAELRRIAQETGMRPLFFTVTAWGGAAVPEEDALPMLAGYAYTPWIPNQPPSREFLFKDLHTTPAESVNYNTLDYPVAYCEMAGGMQVSYTARPLVPAESIEAMTLVKLASGSNLLGYYMYHGGTNPVGRKGYLNESGLPKMTYDYQSPLGEFGRVGDSYDRIRAISHFLQAFGDILAPMGTLVPEGQDTLDPADTETVRWCVRQKDGSGFIFLNNFQDHVDMPDRECRIELETTKGSVTIPQEGTLTLKSGMAAVLPFHLKLGDIELIGSTAQLLTSLSQSDEEIFVFAELEGTPPELVLHGDNIAKVDAGRGSAEARESSWILKPAVGLEHQVVIDTRTGRMIRIVVLSREESLRTYRFDLWGEPTLAISSSRLTMKDDQLVCVSEGNDIFSASLFPAPAKELQVSAGKLNKKREGLFTTYTVTVDVYEPGLSIRQPSERSSLLRIGTDWPKHVSDVFLTVEYDGDVAAAYLGNRLLTDHIHYGKPWPIGLKQFRLELEHQELHLHITPLRKGTVHTFVNQAFVERFEGVEIGRFHNIKPTPHYEIRFTRSN